MTAAVEIYNHFLLLNSWYWSVPQHQSCEIMPKKKLMMNARCWLSNKLRILEYLFRDNAHPFFSWYTTDACPLSALAGGTGAADRNYCHKLNSRYGKTRANIAFYAISFGNSGVLRRPKCPLWLNLFISLRQGRVSHPLLSSSERRWWWRLVISIG